MIILRLSDFRWTLLVRRENVCVNAFREVDWLGDKSSTIVTSFGIVRVGYVAHELIMSRMSTYGRWINLINRIQSQMLPRHSVPWHLGHDLQRVLLLLRNSIKSSANWVIWIVFVEILECIFCKAHSSLIIYLLLLLYVLLFTWILTTIVEDNFSSLSLNIDHSFVSSRTHVLNIVFIEALGLLLSFHSGIVPGFHAFCCYLLIFA